MKRKALKAIGDVLHPGKAWMIISDEIPGGYWDRSYLEDRKATLIKQGYTVEELEIEENQMTPSARRWPHEWLVDAE
jgi:hypothetical protein